MKKIAIMLAALAGLTTISASAERTFSEVFPVNFSEGIPTGWAIGHDAVTEQVPGGLKVTCSQEAPKYRADIKYNMIAPYNNDRAMDFTMDASEYSVFAIKFIGKRPESGRLKLSNINVNGSWIKGAEGYSLSEQGWKELTDAEGNSTYYWTVGGEKWTGELNIQKIEIVIADITSDADKSYTVSQINWYKNVEDLRASLETEKETAVVNQNTSTGYADLTAAISDAQAGDVLLINEDQTVSKRIDCKLPLTIQGNVDGVKIVRENAANMMFLCNSGDEASLTIKNIILDGANQESTANFIEASGGKTVTLDNVTIANAKSSNALGLIVAKNSGKLVLNNVKAENCQVNENTGEVFFGTGSNVISGDNSFNISIEKYTFAVEGTLTNVEPIKIYRYKGEFEAGNVLVKNCEDATKFELGNSILSLEAVDGNLVLTDKTAGVEVNVADNNEEAVYYNLQGVKVDCPSNGLYVMKKGDIISKVIIR